MTTSNARISAAILNNLGVEAVRRGDQHSALRHFRDAIQRLHSEQEQEQGHPSSSAQPSSDRVLAPTRCKLGSTSTSISINNSNNINNGSQRVLSPDAPSFTNPIMLDDQLLAYSEEQCADDNLCFAVIIFNLGAIWHNKGNSKQVCNTSKHARVLGKALQLYENCCRMLSHSSFLHGGCTGVPAIDLLIMACYNNMTHIRYELMDFAGAHMLLERLVHFASTVSAACYDCDEEEATSYLLEQKSMFLLNTMLLSAPVAAKAA